jgi:tRNA threonylcarbamoyladenosine biosynthesis protein TsaE
MTDVHLAIDTADGMRAFGMALAKELRGGDVIVLTGDLGAGKTTLTQGIAVGLGITEQVTSPTFVISRVHENPAAGPSLVHVDAYRLGSLGELDDLDLDHDLATSVVVVEWGGGLVDELSESRVTLALTRSDDPDDERRDVAASASSSRLRDVIEQLAERSPAW